MEAWVLLGKRLGGALLVLLVIIKKSINLNMLATLCQFYFRDNRRFLASDGILSVNSICLIRSAPMISLCAVLAWEVHLQITQDPVSPTSPSGYLCVNLSHIC